MKHSFIIEELSRLPQVKVEYEPDADRLLVRVAGRAVPLRVVIRASGYPRDVREAVRQAQSHLNPRETLFVCAPALTSSSQKWLQQEGIAYLDEQGNVFLSADGIYLFLGCSAQQAGKSSKPGKSAAPVEANIFRGRATQTLHALLHAPERAWHVTELAAAAGVAPGTALKVCEVLEKMLLMERQGRGPQSLRRVPQPGDLLDAWAQKHRLEFYSIQRYYRWMADLNALAIAIGEAAEQQGASYAVTLALGAIHRAPFVTQADQVALLLPDNVDLKRLATDCRFKPADEGYNILLLTTRAAGPLMYRQKQDNLWVASDIQLYLDLYSSPGRGREQADHLRRERIGF